MGTVERNRRAVVEIGQWPVAKQSGLGKDTERFKPIADRVVTRHTNRVAQRLGRCTGSYEG